MNSDLVGGWTNPFEKYAQVKLDHFPKVGMKIYKIYLKPPPAQWYHWLILYSGTHGKLRPKPAFLGVITTKGLKNRNLHYGFPWGFWGVQVGGFFGRMDDFSKSHLPGDSIRDLFGMVNFRDPFKWLESWPPTIGDEKVTTWITWFFSTMFLFKNCWPTSSFGRFPNAQKYRIQDTGYLHNKMHKTMPQIVEIRWSLIHSLSGDTFVTFVGWNDVKTTLKTDSNLRPYHSNWSCLPKNIPLTTDISTLKIDGWFNLIHIQIKKTRYLCF